MELAAQLTNRLTAAVKSTGQEEHDETYKSLCRYCINQSLNEVFCL